MSYFIFKGKNSYDYGILKQSPYHILTSRGITSTEIPGGTPIVTPGNYKMATMTFTLGLRNVSASKIDELYAWLQGSGDLITSRDLQKCFKAHCNGSMNPTYLSRRLGEMTVTFNCEPFRYAVDEKIVNVPLTSGSNGALHANITCAGTAVSYPTFEIVGSGQIIFWINGKYIVLNDVSGTVKIDTESGMIIDEAGNNLLPWVEGDPTALTLNPGRNDVTLTGSVTNMKCKDNARWY